MSLYNFLIVSFKSINPIHRIRLIHTLNTQSMDSNYPLDFITDLSSLDNGFEIKNRYRSRKR